MSICLCSRSREKFSAGNIFGLDETEVGSKEIIRRKGENVIYGKLVRKTLHCSHSWSEYVSPAPVSVSLPAPQPWLGEGGDTLLPPAWAGSCCPADLGSWRPQMPSSRRNLCSSVTGCQLISPALLLGAADRPACGVCCGVSCCCAAVSSLKSLAFDFWAWGASSWQDASAVSD